MTLVSQRAPGRAGDAGTGAGSPECQHEEHTKIVPSLQVSIDDLTKDFDPALAARRAEAAWARASTLFKRAAEDISIGDFASAERNRREANEHAISGNNSFYRIFGGAQ